MPMWIALVALASIVLTAALTWVLWRLNAPPGTKPPSGDEGGR